MMRKIIEVRFSDVDSQGHVNHTSTVEWIGHARTCLLDPLIDIAKLGSAIDYVLVKLDVSFTGRIFWPGIVNIDSKIVNVGSKSIVTNYIVEQNNRVVAEAECVNVFFQDAPENTVIIPDSLRSVLESHIH